MNTLQELIFRAGAIPLWQLLLPAALGGGAVLTRRPQFSLLPVAAFPLYWLFQAGWADLASAASLDLVALSFYLVVGLGLGTLFVYVWIAAEDLFDAKGPGAHDVARAQRAILKRIDQLEAAVDRQLGDWTVGLRRGEEQREQTIERIAAIAARLDAGAASAARSQQSEILTAESPPIEPTDRPAPAFGEDHPKILQALLDEQAKAFQRRAASFQEVVDSLNDRIRTLEDELRRKEAPPEEASRMPNKSS
jgi:hypothetical protein